MSSRMPSHCLALTAGCFLIGCAGGGGYLPSHQRPSTVNSMIHSGTREFAGTEFFERWDVDIAVSVKASGDAFGFFQSSFLRLWGDERFARDTDSWFCINNSGWPNGYDVTAEYIPGYGSTGTIRVTVEVDDFTHPNSRQTVYSCDHLITWE